MSGATANRGEARDSGGAVAALVTVMASAASALLAVLAHPTIHAIAAKPLVYLGFLALTLCLAAAAVDVYGKGTLSFAGAGQLAVGFLLGPGPAMVAGVAAAALLYVRTLRLGAKAHRAIFNAANFALSAGIASGFYRAVPLTHGHGVLFRLLFSVAAGGIYCGVNLGLLSVAMGLAEGRTRVEIFNERFRWMVPYYVASGALALALVTAYQKTGVTGLLAFVLPPVMMMLSIRQYVRRTRQSVEEIHAINAELEHANRDLRLLFDFSGGLAARTHDRDELLEYAGKALSELAGCEVDLYEDGSAGEIAIEASGQAVASLLLREPQGFDPRRWERLRSAVLSQLGTALESVNRIDEVNRRHLATIAALSHSIEAKDSYTRGHTERVAEVAVAIATRLGFTGDDLKAVEVGALLHDIGKIGVPERILQKPGPLDPDEWKVMQEHPVTSERILSGVGLSPIVLDIARSSHERIDGKGYPHGLRGEEIPLVARIVLVADAFDALTTDRPYRKAQAVSRALEEIRAHTGSQFCPQCVAALERVYREEPQTLGLGSLRVIAGAA
jgi:putative nucleotidyltransferase with HDIG domain